MKLIELLTSPWAIVPESLREMQEIYATHLKGDKIDLAAVEARLGRPLANTQPAYRLEKGGVAVLAVEGVIAPKANLFTDVSGGTSAQLLVKQLQTAAADTRVKSVLQVIDSPGGNVLGIPEWGAAVAAVASVKPIVSVSDGVMMSAAYWGGSTANAVYLSGATAQAGSIGVYARMALSQPEPGAREFVRGAYKRGGINGEAPSPEYMARFEAQLDYMYSLFVDTVAANRGVSAEDVLHHMADGRTFIGQQAIDAGLVDGLATVDALIEAMATDPAQFGTRRKAQIAVNAPPASQPAGAQAVGNPASSSSPEPVSPEQLAAQTTLTTTEGTTPMDRNAFEQAHPELFAQLRASFMAEGAQAEQARVAAVRACALPGHEALIETLAADGTTTGAQAAAAVLAAERSARAAHAAAMAADAPAPVALVPTPAVLQATGTPAAAEPGETPEATEARARQQWDASAPLREEFAGSFATYLAFTTAQAAGQVRVLTKRAE